ncbi:MAG: hypothetical protein V4556_02370 [Bacteroidota bacterium]
MKRLSILFLLALFLTGCLKDSDLNLPFSDCQSWVVSELSRSVTSSGFGNFGCAWSSTSSTVFVCGDNLRNARVGNTVVYISGECKVTRTYLHKVE